MLCPENSFHADRSTTGPWDAAAIGGTGGTHRPQRPSTGQPRHAAPQLAELLAAEPRSGRGGGVWSSGGGRRGAICDFSGPEVDHRCNGSHQKLEILGEIQCVGTTCWCDRWGMTDKESGVWKGTGFGDSLANHRGWVIGVMSHSLRSSQFLGEPCSTGKTRGRAIVPCAVCLFVKAGTHQCWLALRGNQKDTFAIVGGTPKKDSPI